MKSIRDGNYNINPVNYELLARRAELFVLAYEQLFTRFDTSLTPDLEFFYNLHRETSCLLQRIV